MLKSIMLSLLKNNKYYKMKQIKIYLIMLIVTLFVNCVSSQTPSANMMKYWFFRDRLQYFAVPGIKIGESQIVCVRNKIADETNFKNVDYGQHGLYQGAYIGVLATEYYLLYENQQYSDATQTYNELYQALYVFNEYWDKQAEPFWGESANENGFFIRGNVPCDFLAADDANNNGHAYTAYGERHLDVLKIFI